MADAFRKNEHDLIPPQRSRDTIQRGVVPGKQSRGTHDRGRILGTQKWNDPNALEKGCERSPLEQGCAGRDRHSTRHRCSDEHRINERVRVIRHHQEWAFCRNVFSPLYNQLRVVPAKCDLRRYAEDRVQHLPRTTTFLRPALVEAGAGMMRTSAPQSAWRRGMRYSFRETAQGHRL